MVVIHHRSHTVETEAIEVELFLPVPQVGEEETQHLRFAIIEEF